MSSAPPRDPRTRSKPAPPRGAASGSAGHRLRAFALVELLIALAIFAVIGAIAYRSLAAVTRARATISEETGRLGEAQFAIALLERDLRQAVGRPIRDENGQVQPALSGAQQRIELTCFAFASPYGGARAQLARIAYGHDERGLARAAYPTLDRGPGRRPASRLLSGQVEAVRFRYYDGVDGWLDEWPPQPRSAQLERLPRAIEVSLTFERLGTIRRVVDLVETDPPQP